MGGVGRLRHTAHIKADCCRSDRGRIVSTQTLRFYLNKTSHLQEKQTNKHTKKRPWQQIIMTCGEIGRFTNKLADFHRCSIDY